MSDVITALSWVNDTVFVLLVNTTLQITLLISLIALIIRIFHIKSAPTRYSLWLFALIAMLLLPFLTPFVPQIDFTRLHHQRGADYGLNDRMSLGMEAGDAGDMLAAGGSVASAGAADGTPGKKMDVSIINPVSMAYFIWCAGAISVLFTTIVVYGKLRKLRLCSSHVDSQAALGMLSRLREKLGIRRAVTLKSSSRVYAPISLGVFSPTIILPDDVTDGESTDKLEMILAHELAHIKRFDYLVRLLQNALKVFFFFHPLFHLIKRNLAREREHICDDWVIDMTEHRSRYAECLVDMLERVVYNPVNIPVTLAMAERKQDIPGRIDMIVDKTRRTATKVPRKALLALLLIGCLSLPVLGGIGLVRFAGARAEDEGKIVFTSDRDGESDLYVMDADGSNVRRLTYGAKGLRPCWSPDGKKIAFTSRLHETPVNEIYVIDADGSNMKRLTDTPSKWGSLSPSWSPDGEKIIFASDRIGSGKIFMMDADGKNPEVLIDLPGWNWWRSSWSPDGKKIAFCNGPLGTDDYAIWVMDADGSNKEKLIDLPGRDKHPVWSPDGKRIVFANWSIGEIYLIDADGKNKQKLADGWCPSWSPDGKRIIFTSFRGGNTDIYVMDADGKNVERLTDNPAWDGEPHWWAAPIAVKPAGKLKTTWGKIKALLRPQ